MDVTPESPLSKWLLRTLLAVCWWGFSARGGERITLVVLPVANLSGATNASQWRYSIPLLLNSEFSNIAALRIPSDRALDFETDSSTDFAFHELGLAYGSELDAQQARKVGEVLEATTVIEGNYRREKTNWILSLQAIDVGTGAVSEPLTASGSDWVRLVSEGGQHILDYLNIHPTPKEAERMKRPLTPVPQALDFFSRAVEQRVEGKPLSMVEENLRCAMTLDRGFATAQQALAYILVIEGKLAEAHEWARAAARSWPDLASVHYVLGMVCLLEDLKPEARKELMTSVRLNPNEAYPYVRLGELCGAEERWAGAVEAFRKARDLSPHDAGILAGLAGAFIHTGKRTEALVELKLAERYDTGTEGGTYLALAENYATLGDTALAIKNYERFIVGAERLGVRSSFLEDQKSKVFDLKARLKPQFITAPTEKEVSPEEVQVALKTKLTPHEYQLVRNPLTTTPEMNKWAEQLADGAGNDMEKAKLLFDGLTQQLRLRHEPIIAETQCLTAEQTYTLLLRQKADLTCQDYTFLYLALARHLGLKTQFVWVNRDYQGTSTCHTCVALVLGEKRLLVDPTYLWFGVPHKEFEVLDDARAIGLYLSELDDIGKAEIAVKIAPTLALAHFNQALLLARHGRRSAADDALRAGLKTNSQDWLGSYARAMVEWYRGNLKATAI